MSKTDEQIARDFATSETRISYATGNLFLNTSKYLGVLHGLREGRRLERERCAKIIIEATKIPDIEVRRGTGVRDHLVIFGERMASVFLTPPQESEET